ncbi:MAG: DUF6773 family protein [Oscillospiraceae bacterium]
MKRFDKKSNLDERQEQALLKIEHNACWLAFWGLLAVMLVELIFFGFDLKAVGGEWLVFLVVALYLFADCMKNGIWDRKLQPNLKTNFLVSLTAGVVCGLVVTLVSLRSWPGSPLLSVVSGAVSAVFVLGVCLISLQLSAASIKKRQAKMEEETIE